MQWCILQERNFANAFRISFDADATSCYTEFSFFPGFLSARGISVRVAVYSVWENEYLQYSSIIFPHCSTVTAASRVSANKCQVSYWVITYHIVLQFSLFVSPQSLQSEHSINFTKINVARKPKRNQYSLYYLGSPVTISYFRVRITVVRWHSVNTPKCSLSSVDNFEALSWRWRQLNSLKYQS